MRLVTISSHVALKRVQADLRWGPAVVALGAGSAVRSFALCILTLLLVQRLQRQKSIMGRAVPKKKGSPKKPTAVAVIIAIAKRGGDDVVAVVAVLHKKLKPVVPER